MDSKKDVTGLLISFIGVIISVGTGFGFIMTLIGMCMMSGVNESFAKSKNTIIGSLITSVAGVSVVIASSNLLTEQRLYTVQSN